MSETEIRGAGALGNLVNQFSSAMDCFRELVQNAVDAGSSVVEISTEYRESKGAGGAIVIRVEDWGEGMDREVIDKQFTRLFASTKRQDLTKIGKFGIGFVSVFALQPKAVIVHTGRGGEYWEVVFGVDRTFQVAPLEHPVEGTQITLVLEGDVRRYETIVGEIRETLKHWCRHSEAEVGFEDRTPVRGGGPLWERINEEFEVPGRCALALSRGTTEIALSFSQEPEHQFYNRGLTLAAGARGTEALGVTYGERFGHVSFKISSPHFGHTLTRETVVRDESFDRGMGLLWEAVESELVPRLAEELEELVLLAEWTVEQSHSYREALDFLARETDGAIRSVWERQILRLVDGGAVSPAELDKTYRRERRVLLTERPSELLERLQARGVLVFWGRPGPSESGVVPVVSFLRRVVMVGEGATLAGRLRSRTQEERWRRRRVCFAPEEVFVPATIEKEPPAEVVTFLRRTQAVMEAQGWAWRSLGVCRLLSAEKEVPLFLLAHSGAEVGELQRPVAMRSPEDWFAVVNRRHPHFLRLLALYEERPRLAVKMLGRCLRHEHLDDDWEFRMGPSEMAVAGGVR